MHKLKKYSEVGVWRFLQAAVQAENTCLWIRPLVRWIMNRCHFLVAQSPFSSFSEVSWALHVKYLCAVLGGPEKATTEPPIGRHLQLKLLLPVTPKIHSCIHAQYRNRCKSGLVRYQPVLVKIYEWVWLSIECTD